MPRSSAGASDVGQHDLQAGVGARHGDAAAHRAGADDRDASRSACVGVSFGTSGTCATARSAKNACISALHCSERRHSKKSLALAADALEKRQRGRGLDRVDDRQRREHVAARLPGELASRRQERRVRLRRAELVEAIARLAARVLRPPPSRAQTRRRPARRSPLISRSTRPAASASAAPIGLPDTHMSIAFSTPTRRGRRCVPSAPGMMPRLTSGRPIRASGSATR